MNALRHPEKTATVFGSVRVTYKELNQRVNRLANAFSGLGYAPGDKVAVLLYNGTEYMECFAGLTKIGVIPVPISYLLKDGEIEAILANSDALAAVVDIEFLDRIMSMQNGLKHVALVNGPASRKGVLHYEHVLTSAAATEPGDRGRMCSSIMIYSSGTTGLPKGIIRSRYGFLERAVQQGFQSDYKSLCVMPLFFSMGAACALLALYLGETMIFARKIRPRRKFADRRKGTGGCDSVCRDDAQGPHRSRQPEQRRGELSKLILISGQLSDDTKSEAFNLFGPVLHGLFRNPARPTHNFMGRRI